MPAVSANAGQTVLATWPVPDNTPFAADDAIVTVETEKAVVDVPADADGVILKTLVPAGAEVEVGAPIALLGDLGETVDDLDALLAELGVLPDGAGSGNGGIERRFSSPLARRLAKEAGIAVDDLAGTGPGGRIVRRDVEKAAAERATSPRDELVASPPSRDSSTAPSVAGAPYADIPHPPMRRAIAARLTQSLREAPHFEVQGTARVDKLLRMRQRLNEGNGWHVSVNDLVVMAAAHAHVLVPEMNVIWTPDAVRSFSHVDLSIAVATDKGLVTPVLRDVDRMRLSEISAASNDLVGRARSGQLRQHELEGGVLTVTNLGVFGTEAFTAIINPPQSAILAVGAARQEPIVHEGRLRVGTVMHVTLSVDHRPIDGAVAAQWMAAFVALAEEPVRILA